MPKDFKVPLLDKYDGSYDPSDHVDVFQSQMHLAGADEACMCMAFSITFKGLAWAWYKNLTPGSIKSWGQFVDMFTANFTTSKKCPKSQESLLNVVPREGKSIRSYIKRFNETCLQILEFNPTVRLTAAQKGVTHKELRWYIKVNRPKTITEFLALAEKFISTEEELN
ncbi:PREDICTED: uncharacterized protein LOC104587836 [Nelumbo nucifera]|uniref:Uncharacterized protein LOC104587836 n=1 Tax=Nelumbo nucifera TaxID=4432 RepID=A0A1U7YU48_NELNU|nr:PREDICTED: uncharacterized protein LOC104587836 [Nelumbo nucifera]